jgi:hypothetical protein
MIGFFLRQLLLEINGTKIWERPILLSQKPVGGQLRKWIRMTFNVSIPLWIKILSE